MIIPTYTPCLLAQNRFTVCIFSSLLWFLPYLTRLNIIVDRSWLHLVYLISSKSRTPRLSMNPFTVCVCIYRYHMRRDARPSINPFIHQLPLSLSLFSLISLSIALSRNIFPSWRPSNNTRPTFHVPALILSSKPPLHPFRAGLQHDCRNVCGE